MKQTFARRYQTIKRDLGANYHIMLQKFTNCSDAFRLILGTISEYWFSR